MKMITATEANRDFSKLLEQVSAGEEILITKHGEVVASIIPAAKTVAMMEEGKRRHLEILRSRKPLSYVKERGTRDELYED